MGLIRIAITVLALLPPAGPPDHVGWAVRYGPGAPGKADVMSQVAANRGIPWRPYMAAYTFAKDSDMGKLWLHIKGPHGEADFLVIDLPQPGKDKRNLIARGVVAEMGYWSGFKVCGKRWTGRARDCKVKVWVLR